MRREKFSAWARSIAGLTARAAFGVLALLMSVLVLGDVQCEPVPPEGPAPGTARATGEPPPDAPPMPTAPPPGARLTPTAPPPGFPAPVATATAGGVDAGVARALAAGEYAIGVDADGYDDSDPAALTDFRAALDPYGSWADDSTYGTVWTPSPGAAGSGFAPYVSSGHWAYDGDWVWVSDYPWGWAPFHYGRWALVAERGWSWIPGRTYRGAWVSWAVDDGYGVLGWAPLAPEFVWVGGVAMAWRGATAEPYVYCPRASVFAPTVATKILVGPAAVAIAGRMHLYVAVMPGGRTMAGPQPARFGYGEGQAPRPGGAGAAGVERALQFAKRSTTPGADAGATRR